MKKSMVATLAVVCVAGGIGCNASLYVRAPERESLRDVARPAETEAFHYLSSAAGPTRFARVADGVYRGGQPSKIDLQQLCALGVRTIVDLRREDGDAWRREEREATALGMKFVHCPFYGVFGQNDAFYDHIVDELRKGAVYVHCKHGRDRTSLVVALYRVLAENWDPKVAWKLEVVDYGSAQNFFYRQLHIDFARLAKRNEALKNVPL
jgi:protein tyrosine phosphatase (PTP) superfamily phosphohydrolase (DUF442 family)